MKEKGTAFKKPSHFNSIHMPKNKAVGPIIGMFTFLFGFSMVWYIWWLAVLSFVSIIAIIIIDSGNDDSDFVIPATEVERIETELYHKRLAAITADAPEIRRKG